MRKWHIEKQTISTNTSQQVKILRLTIQPGANVSCFSSPKTPQKKKQTNATTKTTTTPYPSNLSSAWLLVVGQISQACGHLNEQWDLLWIAGQFPDILGVGHPEASQDAKGGDPSWGKEHEETQKNGPNDWLDVPSLKLT